MRVRTRVSAYELHAEEVSGCGTRQSRAGSAEPGEHDLAGMDALHAKTVAALKKALPSLEAMVAGSEAAALDFFQFAFRYCLMVRTAHS